MREDALNELTEALVRTGRLVRERLAARRGGAGSGAASHVRLATLKFIRERGNPSMKDLAAHLSITPPSATLLVDALSRKGFVRRRKQGGDRRGVRLSLTPKGRTALAAGNRDMRRRFRDVIAVLDPGQRKALLGILRRLAGAFGKE